MDEAVQIIEQLHRRYAGVIYDKCLRILGDRAAAEDAVQETFVSAFRALDRYEERGRGHLPWLYRIATHASFKLLRARARTGQLTTDVEPQAAPGVDQAELIHLRRVLVELLDQLDERGQEIVVAYYFDGIDQGEIGRQLGISRRAVVKRLTSLRAAAGRLMEGHDG